LRLADLREGLAVLAPGRRVQVAVAHDAHPRGVARRARAARRRELPARVAAQPLEAAARAHAQGRVALRARDLRDVVADDDPGLGGPVRVALAVDPHRRRPVLVGTLLAVDGGVLVGALPHVRAARRDEVLALGELLERPVRVGEGLHAPEEVADLSEHDAGPRVQALVVRRDRGELVVVVRRGVPRGLVRSRLVHADGLAVDEELDLGHRVLGVVRLRGDRHLALLETDAGLGRRDPDLRARRARDALAVRLDEVEAT